MTLHFSDIKTPFYIHLLRPFAEVYALVTDFRNWLYDKRYFKSVTFDLPIISVGNLSVGGTGKSPHIEYLISLLQNEFRVGVLSRGYGRKTREYIAVQSSSTAEEVGDEPLMFKQKFPNAAVAVAIDRIQGIPLLLTDFPETDVVLLDDAFQHRAIHAGLTILLTDFSRLFTDDFVLPAGRLRERKKNYKRADIIIVTKCPQEISSEERTRFREKIKPHSHQRVYFSSIEYGTRYPLFSPREQLPENILVVTGVANGKPLEDFLKTQFANVYSQHYNDHHTFDRYDLESIRTAFNDIGAEKTIVITTEKDAARLLAHRDWFEQNNIPLYVQPIRVKLLGEDEKSFRDDVLVFLNHFSASVQ